MNKKTKYKYRRNFNLLMAGISLGTRYILKKNNHKFLVIIPTICAVKFLIDAYDDNYEKKLIEKDEERIEKLTKELIKEPIK